MLRAAVRTTPRALRKSTVASATGRRFASTAPADTRYTWKGTAARWALAIGALYWYKTSNLFADERPSRLSTEPPHFSESDFITVDAIVEEKRKALDARLKARDEQAAKDRAAQSPPPRKEASAAGVATAEDVEKSPEQVEEEAGQQGAFNPETGEINWDCPCLGGMAHGPCGEEFKAAFSCFVYSTEEVKGMDCVDKFQHMQDCFRKYPEVYGEEIADEEAAEREAEAAAAGSPAAGGDVQNAPPKGTEAATSTPAPAPVPGKLEKSATPAKLEAPVVDQEPQDATAAYPKAMEADATKPAAATSPVAPPKGGDGREAKKTLESKDRQRSIPQRSFDATSANTKETQALFALITSHYTTHSLHRYPKLAYPLNKDKMATYADIAAKNSYQTPEEAAAPPVPEIEPNESQTISTESLVDVDNPSVRSVPSDFMEQSIQTDTQAERVEREEELNRLAEQAEKAKDKAKVKKEKAKEKAKGKARETDHWLVSQIAALSENQASGIVFANLAAVVGLSAVLGYKAWGLHERNALSWKHAGVGAAIVGAVGVAESVFSRFFTKARGSKV